MTEMILTAPRGQSLVELVIITPILVLVLVAGFSFGLGLYNAHMASDAVRQPAMKKLEMADNPGAISEGQVMDYITGSPVKGTIKTGALVDSVRVVNASETTSVIVGSKTFNTASWLPALNFTATQGIQKNLMMAADAGAKKRPAGTPWVPGGSVKQPPWEKFKGQNLPPNFQMNPGCQTVPVGGNIVDVVNRETKPDKSYISTAPVAFFSPVSPSSLAQIAATFARQCANADAGVCQQEYNNFLPKDHGVVSETGTPREYRWDRVFEMDNPPGAPGMKVSYRIWCLGDNTADLNCKLGTGDPKFRMLPNITPNHGWYYDPSGKYEKPPADFVASCKARKQAECQLEKAVKKAKEVANAFRAECNFKFK